MTSAPSSMPRLNPGATIAPNSGLLKATRRTKPKYTTIMAMVSEMAMRHLAAETASSEEGEDIRASSSCDPATQSRMERGADEGLKTAKQRRDRKPVWALLVE